MSGSEEAPTSSEEEDAVTQTRPGTRPAAQTLKEWLTNEYGADLSAVTAISGVPSNVTGSLEPLANCTALVTLDLRRCKKLKGPCPRPAASKSPT